MKKAKKKLTKKAPRYARLLAAAKRHKLHVVQDASPVQMVRELFERAFAAKKLRAVWNIVCGMRGPDGMVGRYELKEKYTTPLRKVVMTIGQAIHLSVSEHFGYVAERHDPRAVKALMNIEGHTHFTTHIEAAAQAMQEK